VAKAADARTESKIGQVSLPAGAGKIQGMGESFTAELSTGVGGYSIPLKSGGARGGAQPSLSLNYTSSRGHGVAGLGWSLGGVAFVARQTDRGVPGYQDPPGGGAWNPTQDRFVFGGGQELVPICRVSNAACESGEPLRDDGANAKEVLPAWANG